MLSLLVTVSVFAANPSPVKLAAPTLSGSNMKPDELTFFTDHLAQQLGFHNLRVITSSEIQQLLGFERQKELLGCADNSASCQAELANALGVDALVTGGMGRVGKSVQINLKIIKPEDGTPLAAYSVRATSDEDVLDKLTEGAAVLAKTLNKKLGRAPSEAPVVEAPVVEAPKKVEVDPPKQAAVEVPPSVEQPVSPSGGGLRTWAWAPAAVGLVAGVTGAFFIVDGNSYDAKIRSAPQTSGDVDRLRREGEGKQQLGAVMVGVGAAAVAAGAAMYLFGGTTQVAVVPGPQPAVAVSGTFDLLH